MDWSSGQHNGQHRLSYASFSRDERSLPNHSLSPPHTARQDGNFEIENTSDFLSPLSNISFDQFVQDPVYLQSQETLRSLLFSTAQSTAPTRAPSPIQDNGPHPISTHGILLNKKRIEYLKNYVAEVAPWVRGDAYIYSKPMTAGLD